MPPSEVDFHDGRGAWPIEDADSPRGSSRGISSTAGICLGRLLRLALLAQGSLGHVFLCGLAPEGLPEVDTMLRPPPNSIRDSSRVKAGMAPSIGVALAQGSDAQVEKLACSEQIAAHGRSRTRARARERARACKLARPHAWTLARVCSARLRDSIPHRALFCAASTLGGDEQAS